MADQDPEKKKRGGKKKVIEYLLFPFKTLVYLPILEKNSYLFANSRKCLTRVHETSNHY